MHSLLVDPPSSSPSTPFVVSGRGAFLPSTPSSTTLNSSNSGSQIPHLRRSMSDMSNSSDSFILPALDPRVQRVKRAESFGGAMLFGPGQSLKRAPSFGATSKRSSGAMSLSSRDSDVTSSDEEEKLRSMKAKKARVKATSTTPPPSSSPVHSPEKHRLQRKANQQVSSKPAKNSKESSARRSSRPKANLQRNPSILGGELPQPQSHMDPPKIRTPRIANTHKTDRSLKTADTAPTPGPVSRVLDFSPMSTTPSESQNKPLRRSKGAKLPQRSIARKISFNSLTTSAVEENINPSGGNGLLGSAFQLH